MYSLAYPRLPGGTAPAKRGIGEPKCIPELDWSMPLPLLSFSQPCSPLPPWTHQGNSRARNTGVEASAINIDNFGRVAPTFYRGAQPDGRDYADLKALGIKTIINLTSDDADPAEQTMAEQAGIAYVQIPMSTHTAPTAEQLASFLRIVNDPASQPVYVHCVGGRHRTGVMTAAYRMTQEGWTSDQAFREMKQIQLPGRISCTPNSRRSFTPIARQRRRPRRLRPARPP